MVPRTIIIAAAAVVVAAAAVAWFFFQSAAVGETATVARGDIYEDIFLAGSLADAKTVDLSFSIDGAVSAVFATEEKKVFAGEKLVVLDDADVRAQLKQYAAKKELTQLKLAQLLAGTKKEEIALAESKVASARVALENARTELANVQMQTASDLAKQYALATDYADTILLNAENAVRSLGEIYDDRNKFRDIFIIPESKARSDAEWQVMFAKTAMANIAAEHARVKTDQTGTSTDAALAVFKINLEVVRSSLQKTADLLEAGTVVPSAPDIAGYRSTMTIQRSVINATQTTILTFEQDIVRQKLDGQVAVAKAHSAKAAAETDIKTLESDLSLKQVTPSNIDIAVAQAEIKEYNASMDALSERLARLTLTAPADGIIGRVAVRTGSIVRAFAPIAEFTVSGGARFEASVTEEVARKIRGGDGVTIRAPGMPDIAGGVLAVDERGIVVVAADDGTAWSAGATAEIVVHAVKKHDVLLTKKSFITPENGGYFASVRSDDGIVKTMVLAGDEWRGSVEIVGGLSEGDVLVK